MSDDLDLMERFEPLATAAFVARTDPSLLRRRVGERRRRRRMAAGGTAAVVVVLGTIAALALARGEDGSGAVDQVRAGPAEPVVPDASGPPASFGTRPRLVVGVVPEGMASQGCGADDEGQGLVVTCGLGVPATAVPDGINLATDLDGAPDDVVSAWDDGEAEAVGNLVFGGEGDPAFTTIAGRKVLALGETDRVDGSPFDQPDRVARTYAVLSGALLIQINAEGVTEDQLAAVIGGLGTEPADLGFSIPDGVLPGSVRAVAQGQQRPWYEPDPLDPSRSVDPGGDAAGITYAIDGQSSELSVTVVRGVDAAPYVDTWGRQQEQQDPASRTAIDDIDAGGRVGKQVGLRPGGAAGAAPSGRRVAVAADATTVVLVEGPTTLDDVIEELAARTDVQPPAFGSTGPTTTQVPGDPDTPDPDTPDPGREQATTTAPSVGTGWYVPEGLPSGWTLEQTLVQGVDGSGQAQLWMGSPTGNLVLVTLRVPVAGSEHTEQATPYPLPGSTRPVYREPSAEPGYDSRVTSRDDADIRVDWIERKAGDPDPTPADQEVGNAEIDQLLLALVPATAGEWRAFIAPTNPATPLLQAATLEALPDAT